MAADPSQAQPQLTSDDMDGVRWTWAAYPGVRLESAKMVVPQSALYTPLKQTNGLVVLPYDAVRCKTCSAALNPYCRVDFQSKFFSCPFCMTRNAFPAHYADISETNLPAELYGQFTTIEYTLPRPPAPAPFYMFVVDTCLHPDELKVVKDSLGKVLNLLPEHALVGLITYGTNVQVFELGFAECVKAFVLRGTKEYSQQQLQTLLGLPSPAARFMMPLADCLFALEGILDELSVDPWPVKSGNRPQRCTGAALAAAVSLAETLLKSHSGRIVLMTGGAATVGPGMIVEQDQSLPIRSHSDMDKGKAPASHVKAATKFYSSLGQRSAAAGHTIDIYACSLDQVGLHEMRPAVHMTGGLVFLADLFDTDRFRGSFDALVQTAQPENGCAYNVTLEVQTSREWKVSGVIGSVTPVQRKTSSVGETELGYGGTAAWRANSLLPTTALGVYFEVSNAHAEQMPQDRIGYVQFQTTYALPNGQTRLRITTQAKAWTPTAEQGPAQDLAAGFDQETAAVLVARLATFRALNGEDRFDIIRWLDRLLIRIMQKFAEYRKDDPTSLRVPPQLALLPQFFFHLRRSTLIQTFNATPDESAFFRETFLRQTVVPALVIIQPTIQSFSFDGSGVPVLLDATSVLPDRILLLDSFFEVVVFHGETIAQWKRAGYHEQPQYAAFAQLLVVPKQLATQIVNTRFPRPRYVECEQHDSQSRLLMARVNPSVTHQTGGMQGDVVFTEDVSLQVFMDHLKRLAVQQ